MAVRFDAATDRITYTGTSPTPSSGYTATCWLYISVDRNDFSTFLRLHAASGATTVINAACGSDGVTPEIFTAGGSSPGPQSLPVAGWARVAITVTGTTSKVYVATGSAGATMSTTGNVGSSGATAATGFTVGGRSAVDGSEWYDGRIAYLRMWTTVLTQSEIEAEWAAATPVRTSLLWADYPLLLASNLLDQSGNGRHLSAGSTAVSTEGDPPVSSSVAGTFAASLPSLTTAAAGGVQVPGVLVAALPALTATAAGDVAVAGTLAVTLPALTAVAAGSVQVAGELAAILPVLDAAASGPVVAGGGLVVGLPAVTATVAGGVDLAGHLAGELPALTTSLTGGLTVGGVLAVELPALTAGVAGGLSVAGTVGVVLPTLSAAFSGDASAPVAGNLLVTLPALTMGSARTSWPPAVDDAAPADSIDVTGPFEVAWLAVG